MGEATARVFAAAGAHVLVSDINAEAGEATAESIRQDGGDASFVRTDVSNAADAEAMVRTAVERHGRLDCAVNNAAVTPDTHPLSELDEQEWDRILGVDLKGVALCCKYEIAQMLAQGGGGAIVNIGSVSSFRPQPNNAAYVAATSVSVGSRAGSTVRSAPSRTSSTASPRSECRSYASPRAPLGASASFVTVAEIAAQPRPIVRWSASAKGRPVKNTAAIGSSSGPRVRR